MVNPLPELSAGKQPTSSSDFLAALEEDESRNCLAMPIGADASYAMDDRRRRFPLHIKGERNDRSRVRARHLIHHWVRPSTRMEILR